LDIRIGEVVAPHGLDGGLKVLPASDHHRGWRGRLTTVAVDRWAMRAVGVREVREAAGLPVLWLDGVTTRSQAEALVGARLFVDAATLPPLPSGQYWWHELLDLPVEWPDGMVRGQVAHVLRAGPHDVLEVTGPTGHWLVPFVRAWVTVADAPRRLRLLMDPGDVD
jgi:16S rRNA processing protein RimM